MENFKSNSAASKAAKRQEKKTVKKVARGEVYTRKQPVTKRMKEVFFGADLTTTKEYIFSDIVVPTIKDMLFNIINGGVSTMFYGHNTQPSRGGVLGRTNYRYSSSSLSDKRQSALPATTPANSLDEIVFKSRADAESVLEDLRMLIEQYEWASVQDFYSLSGQEVARRNWTMVDWGWETLAKAYVEGIIGGGYVINMPKPRPDK